MQLKKKLSSAFLAGLLIGGLFFGTYGVYSAIQQEVGINYFDHVNNAWNRACRAVFQNSDATNRDTVVGCGIGDVDAMLWLSTGGATVDRARDITGVSDAYSGVGLLANAQSQFNGATFDRVRSMPAGDAVLRTGIPTQSPLTFNGATFDRSRDVNTANSTAGTGVQSSGPLAFNTGNNVYVRNRASGNGDLFIQGLLRQSGIQNSETTGAANTAVVITLTTAATEQAVINKITARCSAGTASITVTNGTAQVWSTQAGAVTTANLTEQWTTGLTSATGADPVITLSTCGAGNTGTLMIQANIFAA
jgi:hypothetical protein